MIGGGEQINVRIHNPLPNNKGACANTWMIVELFGSSEQGGGQPLKEGLGRARKPILRTLLGTLHLQACAPSCNAPLVLSAPKQRDCQRLLLRSPTPAQTIAQLLRADLTEIDWDCVLGLADASACDCCAILRLKGTICSSPCKESRRLRLAIAKSLAIVMAIVCLVHSALVVMNSPVIHIDMKGLQWKFQGFSEGV